MSQTNNLTTRPINTASLVKRMLIGAGIGLILITLFLSGVKNPRLEWGDYWMIKPLIVVPFAGAVGGAVYYYFDELRSKGGWNRIIADVLSLIIFIIGMWLGSVLGLNGTLWN